MSGRRAQLRAFARELGVVMLLGVTFALGLLWLLNALFPEATGLGRLVTASGRSSAFRQAQAGAGEEGAFAVLSEVRRDVRDKPEASVVWSVARRGVPLADGHAIQSYEGSGATITFDDHNTIEIGEKSIIVLRRPRDVAGTGHRRASILFMDGFLRGRLGQGSDGSLDVEVVAGGSIVRPVDSKTGSADIALSVDKSTSALSVHQGQAEVVWNGKATVVPAGYMVTFEPDRAPGVPAALPKAVTLETPRNGERFPHRGAPPPVRFSWRPTDDTREFTVQIARDPKFSQVLQSFHRSDTSVTYGNLSDGSYHWRVIGVRDSVAGAPSAAGQFSVERHDDPPKLSVQFPDGVVTRSSIVLRGSTEPSCRVVIGERDVPTDAEGRFEHVVEIRDGYNFLVVQAIDTTGNTAFESHTVVAKLTHPKESR